jgi:hypothetical protein
VDHSFRNGRTTAQPFVKPHLLDIFVTQQPFCMHLGIASAHCDVQAGDFRKLVSQNRKHSWFRSLQLIADALDDPAPAAAISSEKVRTIDLMAQP